MKTYSKNGGRRKHFRKTTRRAIDRGIDALHSELIFELELNGQVIAVRNAHNRFVNFAADLFRRQRRANRRRQHEVEVPFEASIVKAPEEVLA